MLNKSLVLRKDWGGFRLRATNPKKGLKGQNASEMRGLGHISIYIYIYML